tara:strand:+ start:517 stop:867 length:351 start_codon:yes stop_codon:yes gene_type:complete
MNTTQLSNQFIEGIIDNIFTDFKDETINQETINKMKEKYISLSDIKKKKKKKPSAPRKKTPFDIFKMKFKDEAVLIAQKNNSKWLSEVSIMWKALSDDDKLEYKTLAENQLSTTSQ